MSIKKPSKGELLERYAGGEPNLIIALDAYNVAEGRDKVISSEEEVDPDGHCVKGGIDYELTSNCPDIRLLIKPGSDEKTVMTLLSKIAAMTEGYLEHLECFAKESNSGEREGITLFPLKKG